MESWKVAMLFPFLFYIQIIGMSSLWLSRDRHRYSRHLMSNVILRDQTVLSFIFQQDSEGRSGHRCFG